MGAWRMRSYGAGWVAATLLLSGCGGAGGTSSGPSGDPAARTGALPGAGKPPITIGDKNFTEQFILGELYAQALNAQGYDVVLNRDIGPTEVTVRALASGRLSMYPEYLNTWNTAIAHLHRSFHSETAALNAARADARSRSLALLAPTPFSDTGALAVTRGYAAAHRLHSIADLRQVAQALTLGAPPQFQQAQTGLTRLEQLYGFVPAAFKPLAVGSQFQALDQQTVQAANVSTTDGSLRGARYRLLADPRRAFGWGQVVPVVPRRVLRAEGPTFARTVNRVSALLSLNAIRGLNAQVDLAGQDPAQVATRFLTAHGLAAKPLA